MIDMTSPEYRDFARKLIRTLCGLQITGTPQGRTGLLLGLPAQALTRDPSQQLDITHIVDGLARLGRLLDRGGTRPLVVLIENALESPVGEHEKALKSLMQQAERLYGDEAQPAPAATKVSPEALIFGIQRDSRLSFQFIEGARRTASGVARLSVPKIVGGRKLDEVGYGTGWILAPGVLITNHHVIDNRGVGHAAPEDFERQAEQVEAWFDFHSEGGESLRLKGAKLLAHNVDLDYAVIELTGNDANDRTPLPVLRARPSLSFGSRVNIIQHPNGGPLQLAVRNNFYVREGEEEHLLQYQTDTEPGASGSPVCDDRWNVVGLHHAFVNVPAQNVPQEVLQGQPVQVRMLNEAISLAAILADLPAGVRSRIPLKS